MKQPVRRLLAAALALASVPAFAQTFSQTVFFGDSLTDSGHFRPALIQIVGPGAAAGGRFTTNPGLVWAEYFADFYGTPSDAVSDNQGGLNFAVGGARTGTDSSSALGAIPSLQTQLGSYLGRTGGSADPDALYTVWGGANDLFAATADPSGAPAIVSAAVASNVGVIATLQNAGARYILVPTIPDLGITPQFRAAGPAGQAQGTALATAYNNGLFAALSGNGLRVIPLDTFHLLQEIAADPTPYGFGNATTALCANSLQCTAVNSGFVFADGVHPSTEAHRVLADHAIATIEAPRRIATLPNAAAMVGRSRAERVAAHVGAGGADGVRWWSDVRGDFQRYGDGDLYDGAGPSLTVGVDWKSGAFVFGGFAGYGRQQQDWGLGGGSYDQSDATLGGFVGWQGEGGGWANAQVSWTQLDFDIDRDVRLGPAVRTHRGSADGENLSAGLSAGWEFGEGAMRHGPVLGVLAQRIDIDGFAEDQPTLSTSLAYPDQSFDSLIGSAGWQVRYAANDHFQPYARLTVDREFEDAAEEAWAQSQSLPGTAPYAVPGVRFDQDYSTLTVGARTALFGLDANLGFSATAGQKGGNHATVFATVGAAF